MGDHRKALRVGKKFKNNTYEENITFFRACTFHNENGKHRQ